MSPFDSILGQSEATAAVRAFGRRAASVDAPVLLTGESGTGKGLLARAIHRASDRARRGFITINCAGVPESLFESEFFGHDRGAFTGAQHTRRGVFEQAHAGTLFLDEIAEMTPALQAKLLTALEDGEIRRLGAERSIRVDVRIIAATNEELETAVRERRFRRDLYHRLLVLSFRLPALRERNGDLEFLARTFLEQHSSRYRRRIHGLDPAALRRLHDHPWPGNIRELDHAIEAAVLSCDSDRLRIRHLPQSILCPPLDPEPVPDASTTLDAHGTGTQGGTLHSPPKPRARYSFHGSPAEERRRIMEALRLYHGNRTRAAEALGMTRNTLRAKLRLYKLDPHTASPDPATR